MRLPSRPQSNDTETRNNNKPKWYEKTWVIVIAFIVCFPVGAILLWDNPRYSKWTKGVVIAVAAILMLCIVPSSDKTASSKNTNDVSQNQSSKSKEEFYPGIIRAHSLWVEDRSDLYDYEDGFLARDREFLLQMVREGRAKFVENPAGVVCSGTYAEGKIIKIRFFEGRYKGKRGYAFADFVQKVKE